MRKKKSNLKNPANGTHQMKVPAGVKRKSNVDEPAAKRKKSDSDWFPGKFVLLNKKLQEESDDESVESPPAPPKIAKKKKNVKKVNGNSDKIDKISPKKLQKEKNTKPQLEKLYQEDSSSSDDGEWMDEEDETASMSITDDEYSEGWSTDTDYDGELSDSDEHSFHESDCESVSDEDPQQNGYWSDGSSEDSDYVPEIEDKYVKPGEAVIYDAKGLDLAFGDSSESQIIDINDIHPALMENSVDEEVPELIPVEEEARETPPESLLEDLKLTEDDDTLESSQLSSCATFHDVSDGVIVQLRSTIHFHGVLTVKSLANTVEINGYTLKPREALTVSSISRADYFLNLTPVIDGSCSSEELPKFDPATEALIHLQQGLPNKTLTMLKTYSPHPLLPSKKMILSNSPILSSEVTLNAKFFVAGENQKVSAFQLNNQWENLELKKNSRLIVIGGKNVGKSTLTQVLINKNIEKFKKILLIDLDIGQPILSPAQTVSASLLTTPVIGPGYLNDSQPDKCLLFGDKSVMTSLFKYVRCVRDLLAFCNNNPNYKDVPWVVNTMGYQKGFGLQLMCVLLRLLEPTDVVQVQHRVKSYNFVKILTEDFVNNFEFSFFGSEDLKGVPSRVFFTTHVLDSIVNNENEDSSKWVSNATDKRKLAMLAQLSRVLRGNETSLNEVVPFRAPLKSVKMLVIDEEFSLKTDLDLLNGNLVYLCRSSLDSELDSSSVLDCFGVGIVRGIDKINEQIYILIPPSQTSVNVLAIANIPLPAEILLKQSFDIAGYVPHVTFFKDRNLSSKKYVNKRGIKDCF